MDSQGYPQRMHATRTSRSRVLPVTLRPFHGQRLFAAASAAAFFFCGRRGRNHVAQREVKVS